MRHFIGGWTYGRKSRSFYRNRVRSLIYSFLPHMNPRFNYRAKRNTAFAMLLAWIFALVSGSVNACLLEVRDTYHERFAVAHSAASDVGHESPSGNEKLTVASHHSDSDATKAPCLKVCDDVSQSLLKVNSIFNPTDPGQAPFITVLWTAVIPVISAPRRVNDPWLPPLGPPLRLRFSRLAL